MSDLSEIIKGCCRGRNDARKALYDLYSEDMFAVCCYYAGSRNEADDIFQDGFIRIFEKIGQYKGDGPLGAWMRRIFVNCALERYRKESRITLVPEMNEMISDREYEETESVINEKALMGFIAELPPRYRMVFNLYAIEGYSHHEISGIMEISEGTSKSNLARARTILQRKLIKNGFIRHRKVSSI
ncbi:MAG: RNA polymerase sigma factor [Bacteroidales bacterium]|nr:RNA polymerase sigma factor [Bacteroidales bacterium]